jgi:prepilin-type N-terminal cleavage/methylation domain-containing protein
MKGNRMMQIIKSNIFAFTLVEVLVALSIISTISAISLMGFRQYFPSYRLKAAALQIKSDMQRASSFASKSNCQYRVVFDPDKMFMKTGNYEIQKGNASIHADYLPEYQNNSFHVGHIDQKDIAIVSWSNNPVFHPNGTIASLATITIQNLKGQQLRISTSIAGRILIKQ